MSVSYDEKSLQVFSLFSCSPQQTGGELSKLTIKNLYNKIKRTGKLYLANKGQDNRIISVN